MDHKDRVRWFAREILPHQADVRRWLSVRVRGLVACDLEEVIQESYARIWCADLERISCPRAYFFVTARHVIGEGLRRARVVPIDAMVDVESLNVAGQEVSAERCLSAQQELARVYAIVAQLPPQRQEAFRLKKFEGLSQREIAQRMNIAESTVEKHLSKALQHLTREMNHPLDEDAKWQSTDGRLRRKR
jgi:RNA polymerase sigma-70 factor (ECF subfamily)